MMIQILQMRKLLVSRKLMLNDDSDCDVYIFTYWDNFKPSKAQDDLDYFEKTLKSL